MFVKDGQNIFDICLQEYGRLDDLVREVLIPNNLKLDSQLQGGIDLSVQSDNKGNLLFKEEASRNGYVFSNRTPLVDFVPNIELSLQWPEFVLGDIIMNKDKIVQ